MKLKYILTFFILVRTGAVRADNEDVKAIRDAVKSDFPTYINANFDSYLTQYFSIRSFDTLRYAQFMIENSNAIQVRIKKTADELDSLVAKPMSEKGPRYEWLVERLRSAVGELDREQDLGQALKTSWANACDDDAIHFAKIFYRPKSLFPVDMLKIDPASAGFHVQVSYQFNFNGQTTHDESGGYGSGGAGGMAASQSVPEAIIMGGSIAIGAGVGFYFGGPAGAYLGAKIGAVVGAVMDALYASFASASKENERWDVLREIRGFMSDTVATKDATADAYIQTFCATSLSHGTNADIITTQLSALTRLQASRLQFAQTRLAEEQIRLAAATASARALLDDLKNTYFQSLAKNYLQYADQYFTEGVQFDNDAQNFVGDRIFPKLDQLKTQKGAMAKIALQNEVWDELVAGDARLGSGATQQNTYRDFSFGIDSAADPRGLWSQFENVATEALIP